MKKMMELVLSGIVHVRGIDMTAFCFWPLCMLGRFWHGGYEDEAGESKIAR